jgi:glycerol-3-phosphate dehydrogenase
VAVAQFNQGGKIMTYRQLIEAALVAVIDAVENDDSDQGLQSAERAIALLKTYLYEVDTCTR